MSYQGNASDEMLVAIWPETYEADLEAFATIRRPFLRRFGAKALQDLTDRIHAADPIQGIQGFVRALKHWSTPPESSFVAIAMGQTMAFRTTARNRPDYHPARFAHNDSMASRFEKIIECWPF